MSGRKNLITLSNAFLSVRGTPGFEIAQYEQLQQAWLKRIEIEYQLMGVTLVLMGTALTIGLQYSLLVLLLYPLVAACLGAICLDNTIKLSEIKTLTGDHDEGKFPMTPFKRFMGLTVLVLIVITEFVSIGLAILKHHPNIGEDIGWYILFILALVTSLLSLFFIYYRYKLCAEQYVIYKLCAEQYKAQQK